jgi:hypothetical protein
LLILGVIDSWKLSIVEDILLVVLAVVDRIPADVDDQLKQANCPQKHLGHVKLASIEALHLGELVRIQNDLHQVLNEAILFLGLKIKRTIRNSKTN